jgi:hypothetical protein
MEPRIRALACGNGCELSGAGLPTCFTSKEKPTNDPRQQTDWKSTKQTDKPWKWPIEKEQQGGARKEDLERWKDTNTH